MLSFGERENFLPTLSITLKSSWSPKRKSGSICGLSLEVILQ